MTLAPWTLHRHNPTHPKMTTTAPNPRLSISQAFAKSRQKGQIALMPFIAAGFPDLATTAEVLPALEKAGASLIEIGIPFSDPIADGPVIQEAFTHALAHKTRVRDVLQTVADVRPKLNIPLVAMVSYSIVFRYGCERFCTDAQQVGFDGLILPDLPPPEAEETCRMVRASGLETVLLVAPTTSEDRRRDIARLSSGFVYYMSVQGITGERDQLPTDVQQQIRHLKTLTDRPVCVGFGISKPEHVQHLQGLADGAIVGTAFVRAMKMGGVQGAVELCTRLLQPSEARVSGRGG